MAVGFKNGRFTFGKGPSPVRKNAQASAALRKLRAFLDKNEPGLVYFLQNLWGAQGKAITYKELREAILAGDLDPQDLLDWEQDYARFVAQHLQPKWQEAMVEAAQEITRKYPDWYFDPMGDGVIEWTKTRSADFVTNVTQTQIQGLRAVIQRAAVLENMSVDLLSRAIRPMVGLTHQQTIANLNYYEKLIESGVNDQKALDLSIRYSARQHRYRGYNIARTELSFAYNQGSYEGTKQAQAAGYMGEVEKVWCTADDERVCSICGSLEGTPVGMDDDFYYEFKDRDGNTIRRRINPKLTDPDTGKVPPAHPSCRCTVIYREISPPTFR